MNHELGFGGAPDVVAARLAAIVESSDDAIVSKNLQGIIQTWNRGAERLFGYSAEEAVGNSILMIIPEDRRHEEDMILSRIGRGEKVDHFETIRRRKDGSFVHVSVTVSAVRDATGKIVGASKIARDLSDRIQVDFVNSRLAAIVESSDDAIVSKNLDGVIQSWNRGAERLFGYMAEEVIGKTIDILLPEDRKDEERRILERLRRGDRVDHFDTVRVRKDGHRVDVSVTISPIRDGTGQIIGASKVARDISERKLFEATTTALTQELEKRVQERTAELEEAHREMEAFTYMMAHDLRTPLRSIIASSRLLLEELEPTLNDEARRLLDRQAFSANQLAQLIEDLLTYTRLGRRPPKLTRVDLSAIARDLAADVDPAEHRFEIEDGLVVCGDESLLRLLLQNLVDNARKFSERGTTITIGHAGTAVFVRDQGRGFDMAYAERIFAPFERLETSQGIPGTGIGLASAKRIIEKLGGSIWVNSVLGEGTTFYFRLPNQEDGQQP